MQKLSYDFKKGDSDLLLVFLHGLACARKSFKYQMEDERFDTFNLLNIDLIGFGDSAVYEGFDFEMSSQAEVVSRLIREYNYEKIIFAAHSMGGAVALLLDDDIIDRITSFANLEGNLVAEDCGLFSRGITKMPLERYSSRLFPRHKKMFSGDRAFDFEKTSALAVYKSAKSLVRWSDSGLLLEKFAGLPCKKAYFYGEENKELAILTKLENVTKYEIPAAGHCMMTDNSLRFNEVVLSFIGNSP